MYFHALSGWFANRQPRVSPRRPSTRLGLEGLEGRVVPTTGLTTNLAPAPAALVAPAAAPQAANLNQAIIAFCQSHVGQKVGGGECAHLANEALRVAGADFAIHDPNHNGDYTWGTLLTTITAGHDSSPSVRCQAGDIIQFQNVTLTGGWTAAQHTAIVAAVDSLGRPTQVYEQNVGVNGKGAGVHNRTDGLYTLAINSKTITAGTMHIYHPIARQDTAGSLQYSIVNNTTQPVTVTLFFNGRSVGTLSLTAFNTAGSYMIGSVFGSGGTFTIGLNGKTVAMKNAGGFEVFTGVDGLASIRAL